MATPKDVMQAQAIAIEIVRLLDQWKRQGANGATLMNGLACAFINWLDDNIDQDRKNEAFAAALDILQRAWARNHQKPR